jgi:hypothetical protein
MKRLVTLAAALAVTFALAGATRTQAADDQAGSQPTRQAAVKPNFVDNDGDGICDNCTGTGQGARVGARQGRGGHGPGDGTGNQGVGPQDGSGYGARSGAGTCDGTGPKGQARRAGRRGGRQ